MKYLGAISDPKDLVNKAYVDSHDASAITASILTSDWASNSATVTATGVTSSNTVILSPDTSSYTDYVSAGIKCTAQGTNTLTFSCSTTPSSTVTVNVVIIG